MVNPGSIRNFEYGTVHLDALSAGFVHEPSSRIEGFFSSDSVPFVFGEAVIIIGVYDGVLSPCKGYAAIRVSITEEPVYKQRDREDIIQPIGNPDF